MQSRFLSLLTLCVVTTFAEPADAQAATDASAVSWWRAEGDTSDALATCSSAIATNVAFTPGNVGQAFSFNGMDSVVDVFHTPSLDLTTSLTIEAWVKRPDPNGIDFIVEKGGDWNVGDTNYGIALHNDALGNRMYFIFRGGGRFGPAINDTAWHHVAVTATHGDVDPIFYVDGDLQMFNDVDGVPQPSPANVSGRFGAATINLAPSTRNLHIGAQLDPNSQGVLYGRNTIDELTIYSAALSPGDIQAIFNAGSLGKIVPTSPPGPTPVAAAVPPGITTWLTGDAVGSTVTDSIGMNDGFASGTPLGQGLIGNGLVFDEDADRVIIPHDASFDLGPTGFSVEFWMKGVPNPNDPLVTIIDKSHGFTDGTGWAFQGDNIQGNLGWLVMDGPTLARNFAFSTDVVLDNCWHHIAGTWDAVDGRMRYYVDGTEYLGDAVQVFVNNQRDLNLGFAWGGGVPQRFFRGTIDEFSTYDRRLSTQEIQEIAAAGAAGKELALPDLPPIADAGSSGTVTVPVGQSIALDGSGSTDDFTPPSGLLFDWSLFAVPLGSAAVLVGDTTATPSFVPDIDGDYTVDLLVTDSTGQTDLAQVTLMVVVDDPPVADAGPDVPATVGVSIQLDGGASTDDISLPANLAYAWTIASAPAGSTAFLTFANTATPELIPDVSGVYDLALFVTDENGQMSVATPESQVFVTASSPNAAPMADPGADATISTNLTHQLDGSSSSDPDGDPLGFQWTLTGPVGSLALLVGETTATPTLTPDLAGTYLVSLVVNDGTQDSSPSTVTIEAIAANVFIETSIQQVSDLVASTPSSGFFSGNSSNPNRQARRARKSRRKMQRLLNKAARDARQLTAAINGGNTTRIAGEQRQLLRKLGRALNRVDGVALRGTPDIKGSGFRLDLITDPITSVSTFNLLTQASDATQALP